jgi:hypothetical protein
VITLVFRSSLIAKYWKNGVPVNFTEGMGNAIFVSGTDVYVAGSVYQTTQTSPSSTFTGSVATLWKNGTAVSLTDGVHSSVAQGLKPNLFSILYGTTKVVP